MSTRTRATEVLEARARRLAARQRDAAPRKLHQSVVVVEAGRERYGLPVARLRAVLNASPITPLSGTPACILGISSVRGELVSVVDLAEVLGRGRTGNGLLFALLEGKQGTLALSVASVSALREIYEDELLRDFVRPEAGANVVEAVTRDLISLIDVDALLASERVIVRNASTPSLGPRSLVPGRTPSFPARRSLAPERDE